MWYNTRMENRTSSYPKFKQYNIEIHDILGTIKVYTFSKMPFSCDDGAQSDFYLNNATPNNERQFGIKMFRTSVEAFAAYQRQALAAKEKLAPPVGMMVRWIIKGNKHRKTFNRWGYETCLAVTTPAARIEATIRGCPQLTHEYKEFSRECGQKRSKAETWDPVTMEKFLEFKDSQPNDETFASSFSALSYTTHRGSVRMRLMKISLVGTQYDNIAAIEDGSATWKEDKRLRLGSCVIAADDYCMSADLHRGNLGMWKKHPVVVDFGYHIAVPQYRDYNRVQSTVFVPR